MQQPNMRTMLAEKWMRGRLKKKMKKKKRNKQENSHARSLSYDVSMPKAHESS
jgi:hypothetical protein